MTSRKFEKFSVYLECAGNSVPKVATIKRFIDIISKLGYDSLYIGTADTYEIEGEPYFGYNRGRYTLQELREIDRYAAGRSVEVIPAIQTLAHLNFLGKYIDYKDIIDYDNILLCDDEKTYSLIDKMFGAIASAYTSRNINIGMDEAFMLGYGKYREKNGIKPQVDIMLKHLSRVIEIASKYRFKCQMWSDMFFRIFNSGNYDNNGCEIPQELKNLVPDGLELIYWSYGNIGHERLDKAIKNHLKISDNITFAGGLWKWVGFIPDNEYSCIASQNAIKACLDNNIKKYVITLWSDNGGEASLYSILPSLYFCSKLNKTADCSYDCFDKAEFKQLFGVEYDDFALIDRVNKPMNKKYTTLNNKSYFYLYNDIFLGNFDSLVSNNIGEAFKDIAEKLSNVDAGEFSYIFKTAASLARVLSVKADLGKRARKYYIASDKNSLKELANKDIPLLIQYIDELIKNFTYQWEKENKTFGIETHFVRLGGLKQRLVYAQDRFIRFAKNEIDIIDEYETKQLPFNYNNWSDNLSEDDLIFSNWTQMAINGYF